MMQLKHDLRAIPKIANSKPKNLLPKMEEKFEREESSKVALMAAKILMFSRNVEIDKIAEALGGRKDEQTKLLLREYCSLIDYSDCKL